MSAMLANLAKFVLKLLVLWVILVVIMYFLQSRLVFHPTPKVELSPELAEAGFEEVSIRTSDNLKITGWFYKSDKTDKAIVYFYGNADRLAGYESFFLQLKDAGYSVLGINYRGYGGSEGTPSEYGLYLDGHAAVDFLRHYTESKNIIVVGRSMGTGVASQMAQDYTLGGVVLISPYTSLKKLASDIYWYLPVKYVGKYNFHSIEKFKKNKAPVLIIHGDKDKLIPYKHAEDLFAAISGRKELVKYEGSDHINLNLVRIGNDIIRFFDADK